jgi:predicted nucleic acid-binding protein
MPQADECGSTRIRVSPSRLTDITGDVILNRVEIVQDTNVFVAALRSQEGASAEVLDRCLALADQAVMGANLLAEYEELIHRESLWRGVPVTAAERESVLDDFCAAAIWQPVYFRWRPNLPDADDDHVLELAIAGGVEHLVLNCIDRRYNICQPGACPEPHARLLAVRRTAKS